LTYTDLQTAVASYLHRSDLTSLLPSFIEYGRIRLFDRLRVPEMVQKATITLTSGEGALSQDLVAIHSVLDDTDPLEAVALHEARQFGSGVYAVQGVTLVAPGYSSLEVIWYDRPLTLVGASGSATRTVLDAYPQLWLQAALAEGFRYLDDTENEQKALQRLESEVVSANARASTSMFPSAPAMRDRGRNVYAGGSGL
jgi:hypothetical protein